MARCLSCHAEFVQRPDVWPQGYCDMHLTCVCNVCRVTFPRDPTHRFGHNHCAAHRPSTCHNCDEAEEVQLARCRKCGKERAFCPAHVGARRGELCLPESAKLPPSVFAAVDFSSLASPVARCSGSGETRPLFHGATEVARAVTERDAIAHAAKFYNALMTLWGKLYQVTGVGLPASQDTICVALLDAGDRWLVIITFNQYDETHVPTPLRSHVTFGTAVLPPDIIVAYDKSTTRHTLYERTAPKTLTEYDGLASPAAAPEGQRCLGAYPLDKRNFHHAEMRAWAYAAKRGWRIVWLAPTRPCCELCQKSMADLRLLGLIPAPLRKGMSELASSLYQVPQHLFDDGDRFVVDDVGYRVAGVLNNGDCLFDSVLRLIAAGQMPDPVGAADVAALRTRVAAHQLAHMPGVSAEHRAAVADAAAHTWGTVAEDLTAMAAMYGVRFVVHQVGLDGHENQRDVVGSRAASVPEVHILHQIGHFQPLIPSANKAARRLRAEEEKDDAASHGRDDRDADRSHGSAASAVGTKRK